MTPKAFNKAMGAVIRQLRVERGLTLKQVAEEVGFSYQQEQKNEYGTNGCSGFLLGKYAAIFGVAVAEMYDRAGAVLPASTPSEAQSAGILAARYVGKIKSGAMRSFIVDFSRKLAYQGEEA